MGPEIIDAWNAEIVDCQLCPRLVEWREEGATAKRRAFQDESYWGRPVPYFGDPNADRLIIGLAPAAHGANRTGRMFTGDRSGDWLYRALHKAGAASQPASVSDDDGLILNRCLIGAVCHCAPPDNKPQPDEIGHCRHYMVRTLQSRPWRSILCLGGIAWREVHRNLGVRAADFGHGRVHQVGDTRVVASYHPSQQNTFTGRLTEAMLDAAIAEWWSA